MASPWSPSVEIDGDADYDGSTGHEESSRALAGPPEPPTSKRRAAAATADDSRRKRPRSKGRRRFHEAGPSEQHPPEAAVAPAGGAEGETTADNPSAPKPLKSKCWKDFTRILKDGDLEVIDECNICHKILKGHSKNGTSHLLRHAKHVHPHESNEVNNYFLKSEKNDDGSYSLKHVKYDPEAVRTAIALFLLGGSHPFSVVEEHGYRAMMSKACPQFKNVSRYTIKRDIMAMFERDRKNLMEIWSIGASHLCDILS